MSASLRLAAVAKRVGRLRPDWNNPERYFEDRSEIERDLRRLAKDMETARG